MQNVIKSISTTISNFFLGEHNTQVFPNKKSGKDLTAGMDAFPESDYVIEQRRLVKERMKELGRKNMLEGGDFSLKNKVLAPTLN